MGRRKREPMSEGKKNIIAGLLQEYDIQTAKDIEGALKDLLEGQFKKCLKLKWTNTLDMVHTSVRIIRITPLNFSA